MILNTEQVKKLLPHRDPFLFIDSVESVKYQNEYYPSGKFVELKDTVGAEVIAHYRTKKEHEIFKGHFPDYPILPGVVQVEMMAQATSFLTLLINDDPKKFKLDVALLGIADAKFRKPIFPEMDLKLVSIITKVRGPIITSECKIYCNDQLMSDSSTMASIKLINL